MGGLDLQSFFVVFSVATGCALLVAALGPGFPIPLVVLELVFGIVVGPQGFELAMPGRFIDFFAIGGLAMLFFFAGYEIDFERIKGEPIKLALLGWLMTLAIAYLIGGLLAIGGVIVSLLYTGTAISTTAIGTLIPILGDSGEIRTRFGTFLLAAGAVGEFGPIVLLSLALTTAAPLKSAAVLAAFIAVGAATAVFAARSTAIGWKALDRGLKTSGQAPIRVVILLIGGLVLMADSLGLDVLLGGFVAGMIVRRALFGREVEDFEAKLIAVGYGFFIPFFFVVSGMKFDLESLTASASAMAKLSLFLVLFVVVRGAPALLLYRREFALKDRFAFGLYSATQLPLVVAITTVAVSGHHMRLSTASALVGAAIISTAVFPAAAMLLRRPAVAAELSAVAQ
jgi:Kef-type K+ transport system membrane component KefB